MGEESSQETKNDESIRKTLLKSVGNVNDEEGLLTNHWSVGLKWTVPLPPQLSEKWADSSRQQCEVFAAAAKAPATASQGSGMAVGLFVALFAGLLAAALTKLGTVDGVWLAILALVPAAVWAWLFHRRESTQGLEAIADLWEAAASRAEPGDATPFPPPPAKEADQSQSTVADAPSSATTQPAGTSND